MCIRDRLSGLRAAPQNDRRVLADGHVRTGRRSVSYTHLRAHETVLDLVCRLLLEKKRQQPKSTRVRSSAASDVYKRQIVGITRSTSERSQSACGWTC